METRKIGGEECGRNRCRAPIAQLVRASALIAEDLGFDSCSSHISPSPVTNLTSIIIILNLECLNHISCS